MLTFSSDILIRERDLATSFIAGIPHCRVLIHRIRPADRRTLQSKHQTRRRSFQIGQIHFRRSLSLDAIAPPPFFLEVIGVHIHPEYVRMTSRTRTCLANLLMLAGMFNNTEIGKKAWLFAKLQPGKARKRINAT